MAAVLGHAYAAIRERVEGLPGQLVLTHPVIGGETQRRLLRDAAERAGNLLVPRRRSVSERTPSQDRATATA
jgi:molecular chaperone DnaK (HSP70)